MSFTIQSNGVSVLTNFRQSILNTQKNLEENLRKAGVEAVAIIAHRVQQTGQGTESRLVTPSAKRLGDYEKKYALRRIKMGRQTAYVDLTLTGDTFRQWDVLSSSPTECVVGFRSPQAAQIASYQEEHYNQSIYDATDSEQDFICKGLADRIVDDFAS